MNYRNKIEKTAKKKSAVKEFMDYNHEAYDLSPQQYQQFLNDVRAYNEHVKQMNVVKTKRDKNDPATYGLSVDNPSKSDKATYEMFQRLKDMNPNHPIWGKMSGDKQNVFAPPSREVNLHEMGHMVDYAKNRKSYAAQEKKLRPKAISTIGPAVGNAAAMTFLPVKAGIPVSLATTGAAAAYEGRKGYKKGRLTQTKEDRANEFAMKYLQDRMGKEKGYDAFHSSVLPVARKTYDNVHKKNAVTRAAMPVLSGTYGAMLGASFRR